MTNQERSSRTLFSWIWRDYFSKQKGRIGVAFVLMAIEGSMLGFLSYMLKPMFDRVFVAGETSALTWVALVIFSLFVIRGLTSVAQKVLMSKASETAGADIRADAVRHAMTLDTAFHETHPPGAMIERIQGDVAAIKSNVVSIITGFGRDVIALLSLFTVALTVDPLWTLAALIGVPILIAPSTMVQRYTRGRAKAAREIATRMTIRLDEIFHGINPIKLNRLEGYQSDRYDALQGNRVRLEVQARLGQAATPGLVDLMTGIGFLGVLFFGGREIISGEKTVGEFMSFFTAMALMFEPVRRLGALSGQLQIATASLERLRQLFDINPSISSPAQPKPVPTATDIQLDDVHLAFEGHPVLRGTSFVAEANKTTALVGASGAGKSTVFNVLTRLIEPTSGSVRLGGTDLSDMNLGDLRSKFSVVTQDALLFDETVRDNITLGASDITDTALQQAIDAAYVSEFIPKLSDGLDSPAGPRGSSLSGGQRQRVAIARALLRDAPILLLDEATSALDAASEAAVQKALDALSKDRTTLVIAHRLSTIRDADKIVVMDRGRVVDEGTHDMLLAREGIYADLYRLQFREEA